MILKADYTEHQHRNITHEVILKENFYTAHKRHSGVCYFQGISWLVISFFLESRLFKSPTWTSISWRFHQIWTVFNLYNCTCKKDLKLLSEELALPDGVRDTYLLGSWLQMWLLFLFLSLPSALAFCHGPVPESCVQWLGLHMASVTFPLRTSPLAWCRLRQFICILILKLWKPTCFNILKLLLLKEWKYISIDNNYCWQVKLSEYINHIRMYRQADMFPQG